MCVNKKPKPRLCPAVFCVILLAAVALAVRTLKTTVKEDEKAAVPILLYHDLCENEDSSRISENTISLAQFENQMQLLADLGKNTVTFDQMIDFVEEGTPLPENPVCLTFDDGYLSNYELAFPVLKKLNLQATVFVIGATVGNQTYYKDTEFPIIPHFSYEQAKEMSDSRLVSIQTHTYDMHQWRAYETGDKIRANLLKLPNETEEEYTRALQSDIERAKSEIESFTGKPVNVLAYPGGAFDQQSQELLASFGIKATLAITPGKAELIQGKPESLYAMNRCYITAETTEEDFLRWIG